MSSDHRRFIRRIVAAILLSTSATCQPRHLTPIVAHHVRHILQLPIEDQLLVLLEQHSGRLPTTVLHHTVAVPLLQLRIVLPLTENQHGHKFRLGGRPATVHFDAWVTMLMIQSFKRDCLLSSLVV